MSQSLVHKVIATLSLLVETHQFPSDTSSILVTILSFTKYAANSAPFRNLPMNLADGLIDILLLNLTSRYYHEKI